MVYIRVMNKKEKDNREVRLITECSQDFKDYIYWASDDGHGGSYRDWSIRALEKQGLAATGRTYKQWLAEMYE